jgi:hypothetical protein
LKDVERLKEVFAFEVTAGETTAVKGRKEV